MPREPEAMLWAFKAASVLLAALSLGKDQGKKKQGEVVSVTAL